MTDNCRLYLITPPCIDDINDFVTLFTSALDAGDVACLQIRLKDAQGRSAPDEEIITAAKKLLPVAHSYGVAVLINDNAEIANTVKADGVHIGQRDTPYVDARALLGDEATIGVTCHNSKHLGLMAGEAGADYVAFGAFYPTTTKAEASPADPEILNWWRFATTVPSVAIGGITPDNCSELVRAGSDFLAVSSSIWNHSAGPGEAVRAFNDAINNA